MPMPAQFVLFDIVLPGAAGALLRPAAPAAR